MKRKLTAGQTSVALPIFIQDTSSTTGGGLGSLVFNTASLVAEYRRRGQSAWTAITLASGTLGTWSSGGFVADGALSGAYELSLPDAVCASSARWVAVRLRGAANMLPCLIEIELDAFDYQTATQPVNTTQFAGQAITAAAGVTIPASIASQTSVDTIDDLLDTEMPALSAAVATVQSDTNDIQTRLPAALESGRIAAALDSAAILAVADQVWDEATSGHTTAGTYGGRIVRATNSNTEVQITGSHHIAADIHELQSGVITAGDFAANSITASALATDAVTEIQSGLATAAALVTLRGGDNDTLKTLSDQIDTVSADVSSIASVSREAF